MQAISEARPATFSGASRAPAGAQPALAAGGGAAKRPHEARKDAAGKAGLKKFMAVLLLVLSAPAW
jgi:hypothetical protein